MMTLVRWITLADSRRDEPLRRVVSAMFLVDVALAGVRLR